MDLTDSLKERNLHFDEDKNLAVCQEISNISISPSASPSTPFLQKVTFSICSHVIIILPSSPHSPFSTTFIGIFYTLHFNLISDAQPERHIVGVSMQLKSITDRMLKSLDLGVNSFLSTIDASLAASREVFRQFDTAMGVVSEEQWTSIQQIVSGLRFSLI